MLLTETIHQRRIQYSLFSKWDKTKPKACMALLLSNHSQVRLGAAVHFIKCRVAIGAYSLQCYKEIVMSVHACQHCICACVPGVYLAEMAKSTTVNILSYVCFTLQAIPLHVIKLPTSVLTGNSSSPVTTSMRPLPHMCGAWMEYKWSMEASLPLIMLIDLSLSWMWIKVHMLIRKLSSSAVWNWQVEPKFVGYTTSLTPSVRYMHACC